MPKLGLLMRLQEKEALPVVQPVILFHHFFYINHNPLCRPPGQRFFSETFRQRVLLLLQPEFLVEFEIPFHTFSENFFQVTGGIPDTGASRQ